VKLSRPLLSGVLLAALLPGCAVLGGGSTPLDTYELTAASPAEGARRRGVQILIAEPVALKSLDSVNIVIKPTANEVQYLKGAQWADRLPKVVQARLAEAFENSDRVGGVGKPGEGLAIDYQIITEIRRFDIRLDGNDRAEIELFVRVLNDRNGTVRAGKVFTAQAAVSGSGNATYAAALDRAFNEASVDIVNWAVGRF